MKTRVFFILAFGLPMVMQAQTNDYPNTGSPIIYDYSPSIILQRNTNNGGFTQGIQTRFMDGSNNWFFGALHANDFVVSKGDFSNSLFSVSSNGNVGIGTLNPQSGLQIGEFNNSALSKQITIPGVYNFEALRLGQVNNGNAALEMVNHNGPSSSYGVRILAGIDYGGAGMQLQYAAPKTSYAELEYKTGIMLNVSGNVGIGTLNPSDKLSVNGKIRAHEIKVETVNWPDYVFEKDYKVLGLTELDEYIKINKHLPEMPSASDAEKNGVELGVMNKLLLKKVEELTLHIIDQDKRILNLEKKSKK